MGKIKKILENELVGGTQNTDVYPVTSTKAVYDENNERLDNILNRRRGVVNISTNYNSEHTAEVLTLAQALSKVPSTDRVLGFQGKYLASDGWHTIIYIGDSLTSWSDTTKWIDLADKVFNSISKNATFAGIATPTTNPGTPDGPVFYIATEAGTYSNFNGISVADGEAVILEWKDGWTKKTTGLATEQEIIYDVSARNGGMVFESLSALLSSSNLSTLIPTSVRHGGMSIRFMQGSVPNSDNKYVQFRFLLSESFITAAQFVNSENWEEIVSVKGVPGDNSSDLDISDENNRVLVRFQNGHIKTKDFDSEVQTLKLSTIEEGAEVNDVETETSEENSDLDFTDENDNVLVRFKGGNVQTKNFNSADFTRKPFEGKNFSILGDSISTFQGYLRSDEAGYDGTAYAYFYPRSYLNNVNQTWWKKLEVLTGLTLMQNCAWSGSQVCGNSQSTISAQAGCSTRRVTDLKKNGVNPDIILIFIGVNDLRNSDSRALGTWTGNDEIVAESTNVATFSAAYSLMVSKVMTAYPHSEVFCCTILDTGHSGWDTHDNAKYPCKNDRGNTTKEWNDTIRMVAESLGAKVLDMHACGIDFFNLDTYTGDRLHPNDAGATLMAQQAARELMSKSNLTIK